MADSRVRVEHGGAVMVAEVAAGAVYVHLRRGSERSPLVVIPAWSAWHRFNGLASGPRDKRVGPAVPDAFPVSGDPEPWAEPWLRFGLTYDAKGNAPAVFEVYVLVGMRRVLDAWFPVDAVRRFAADVVYGLRLHGGLIEPEAFNN